MKNMKTKITLSALLFLVCTFTGFSQTLFDFENGTSTNVTAINSANYTFSVINTPSPTGINTTQKSLNAAYIGTANWASSFINFTLPTATTITASNRYLHIMFRTDYISTNTGARIASLDLNATGDLGGTAVTKTRFDFTINTANVWQDLVIDLNTLLTGGVKLSNFVITANTCWSGWSGSTMNMGFDEILLNSDSNPRGNTIVTSSCTVGDFENQGINPSFNMEGTSGGSVISRVLNPENKANNTTSYALKIKQQGETTWWSRAKILFNNYVSISSATRYLHMMIKCPNNFSVITSQPSEHWYALAPSLRNQWSDVVIDLMSSSYNLSNTVLQSVGICANTSTYTPNIEWYVDEVAFSDNPNPRIIVPSIVDSISCTMNTLDDDWTFINTNPANDILITNNAKLKSNIILNVDIRNESKEPFKTWNDTLSLDPGQTKTVHHELSQAVPGFYRYYINASDGNIIRTKIIRQIGYNPDQKTYTNDALSDFDKFWSDAKSELATVAPAYTVTFNSNYGTHKIYNVAMKSIKGKTINGYLSLPDKAGKFPAIIISNGFGVTATIPDRTDDYVVFTYNIRGQGISTDYSPTDNVFVNGLTDKNTYYYRESYMDAIRAVDFVCSRAEVDTTKIFAEGESQGGALTYVLGALDSRILAISPRLPFLADFPLYYKIKENVNEISEWPMDMLNQYMAKYSLSSNQTFTNLSYFDIKNLARKITCPILMAASLQDATCPTAINFAAYNLAASTSKEYVIFKANGHWSDASFLTYKDAWYQKILNNIKSGVEDISNKTLDSQIRTNVNGKELKIESVTGNPLYLTVYGIDGIVKNKMTIQTSATLAVDSGMYLLSFSDNQHQLNRKILVR